MIDNLYIMNSSENRSQTKQDSGGRGTNNGSRLTSKTTSTPSSSRQWGAFKNPRIVRVSRAFGGKDRHSKVCTIRGLRDRRIRLSVPTAIQLYDLQDRLGLSQPSKVVDWLLEATKHDIDNLPPLAVPPEYFTRFQKSPREEYSDVHDLQQLRSQWINANQTYFGVDDSLRGKSKVSIDHAESWKNKSIASNQEPNREDNMFPLGNIRSPNLLGMPFSSYQWEPNSNLSLGHFGHNAFSSQIDESSHRNGNFPLSLGSSSSPFPSSSQLYYNPVATTFQPIVPSPYMTNYPIESHHDPRAHLNHFNFLTSTISPNNPLVMPTLNLISSSQPRWINSRDDDDDDDDDDYDDDDDGQLFEGRAN